MFSEEEQKWANSTKQEIESIAEKWAKKYSVKKMRTFQGIYNIMLNGLSDLKEDELKGKITDNTIVHMALNNRLNTVARAIEIKEFGK